MEPELFRNVFRAGSSIKRRVIDAMEVVIIIRYSDLLFSRMNSEMPSESMPRMRRSRSVSTTSPGLVQCPGWNQQRGQSEIPSRQEPSVRSVQRGAISKVPS